MTQSRSGGCPWAEKTRSTLLLAWLRSLVQGLDVAGPDPAAAPAPAVRGPSDRARPTTISTYASPAGSPLQPLVGGGLLLVGPPGLLLLSTRSAGPPLRCGPPADSAAPPANASPMGA